MDHQSLREIVSFDDDYNDELPTPARDPLLYSHKYSLSPHLGSPDNAVTVHPDYILDEESDERLDVKGKIVHDFMMLFDQANGGFGDFLSTNQKSVKAIPSSLEPMTNQKIAPSARMQNAFDDLRQDVHEISQDDPFDGGNCDGEMDTVRSFDDKQTIYHRAKFGTPVEYPCKMPNHCNSKQRLMFDSHESNIISDHNGARYKPGFHPENDDIDQESECMPKSKKPFLKKGSRKEPSALHKFGSASNDDLTTGVITASQVEKLEELEKMQRDQIEQLEHRISRRTEARKAILKKKQTETSDPMGVVKMVDRSDFVPKQLNKVEKLTKSKKTLNKIAGADDGNRENKAYRVPSIKLSSSLIEDKPQDQHPTQNAVSAVDVHSPKKSVEVDGNAVTKDPVHLSKKSTEGDENDQFEEQWQVIKCMRKRQETALRDAERDREEVRLI